MKNSNLPKVISLSARRYNVRPSYYQKMFTSADAIYVSDRKPNEPFQKVEETGWTRVEEGCDFSKLTGNIFVKNASIGGCRVVYKEI